MMRGLSLACTSKVTFTLEQATEAHRREKRYSSTLVSNHGAKWGGVNATP
jgi:hypothetical protein